MIIMLHQFCSDSQASMHILPINISIHTAHCVIIIVTDHLGIGSSLPHHKRLLTSHCNHSFTYTIKPSTTNIFITRLRFVSSIFISVFCTAMVCHSRSYVSFQFSSDILTSFNLVSLLQRYRLVPSSTKYTETQPSISTFFLQISPSGH